MGRNLEKTCDVCCKTMRGDNLKRHMKRHDKEPYPKFIYDENSQFSMKKAREFYTNSTGDTFNVLELLDYCYINPNYESISPHDLDKRW